jgi:predicted patatin/cPLA2 family phospholipase
LESLGQLETDFKKCLMDFEKVGDHLKNAQSAYERTDKRLGRLQEKMTFIEMRHDKPLVPEPLSDTAP